MTTIPEELNTLKNMGWLKKITSHELVRPCNCQRVACLLPPFTGLVRNVAGPGMGRKIAQPGLRRFACIGYRNEKPALMLRILERAWIKMHSRARCALRQLAGAQRADTADFRVTTDRLMVFH